MIRTGFGSFLEKIGLTDRAATDIQRIGSLLAEALEKNSRERDELNTFEELLRKAIGVDINVNLDDPVISLMALPSPAIS